MRRHRTAARLLGLIPAAAVMVATTLVVPATAGAATLDVCVDGCALTEIGPALTVARNGDTIRVAAGTYTGGIVIDASVTVIGAGAGKTIIKGGGPVVTIGTFGARNQPTVVLRGLTITGGRTHSSAASNAGVGHDNVIALGGGVEVPPSAAWKRGATVTIRDSAIVGNRAAPTDTIPIGPACPGGPCPFAWARGGGIDSWGDLTLLDTVVAHNTAGGIASDAVGGGISIWSTGSLTLRGSRVASNRAIATIPNGRFAEGGGIFVEDGVNVVVTDSVVSRNLASLTSNLPYDVGGGDTLDMNANGGGIHKGNGGSLTIARSTFRSNRVEVDDPNGEPLGFDSAIHPGDDGPLSITDSVIAANRLTAIVGSSADVGTSGTALGIGGPAIISGTRITGNVSRVVSESGLIGASGAVFGGNKTNQPATIRDSLIAGNLTIAETTSGYGIAIGSGVDNEGQLTLRDTSVINNVATVRGPAGYARGGGIWNGQLITPEPGTLVVRDSRVAGNVVQGDPGVTLEGGGLYTEVPVTLRDTTISGNQPDDCVGC